MFYELCSRARDDTFNSKWQFMEWNVCLWRWKFSYVFRENFLLHLDSRLASHSIIIYVKHRGLGSFTLCSTADDVENVFLRKSIFAPAKM